MTPAQEAKQSSRSRGLLARPLDALVFLLPLILFYEVSSFTAPNRVIASVLLEQFVALFGPVGAWAPGVVVIVVLLATHMASGERWRVNWRRVGMMYVEAMLLSIPLVLLSRAIPLIGGAPWDMNTFHRVALGMGAGVYEELVFRLGLIALLVMIGSDLLHMDRSAVAIVAVLVSAILFAGHHHKPIGAEPFVPSTFLFRSLAGVYLALIFWFRGYGSAAGCHAAYNVVVALTTDG